MEKDASPNIPFIDIREAFPEDIAAVMQEIGEPAFRGEQIFAWLQREAATDWAQMTNISKALRRRLEELWPLVRPALLKRQASADGTIKYLFALADGQKIESVLMSQKEETGHIRHTVCLSCQVGCAMGCSFCSTATLGFRRNLTPGEIVSQILEIAASERLTIHNAVYMGMGEPLLNEEALRKSIGLLNHPLGQNIGIRRISVSTCGLPDGIRRLADWGLDVVLAVSLHAADDATRSRLMPVNARYPLDTLLAACRDYNEITGKRLTFEYVMIEGVNVGEEAVAALGRLLAGVSCNINLIPVNPGAHGYARPNKRGQESFCKALEKAGLDAVIRRERGADVGGACGQLAAGT